MLHSMTNKMIMYDIGVFILGVILYRFTINYYIYCATTVFIAYTEFIYS